jgi:hypothetical protein
VATLPINNPRLILQALDSHLERQTRVVLFGRAALALGFPDSGGRFGATKDVDAILPNVEMAQIESDDQFWKAISDTNKGLEPSGLYLTHLFTDKQVLLTPGWYEDIVSIPSDDYRFLRISRPSAIDLILTKMMRNDEQDLEDIRFIMLNEKISPKSLKLAFQSISPHEIAELQAIFLKMQPIVLNLALEIESIPFDASRSLDPEWWSKLTDQQKGDRSFEIDREMDL